MIKCCMKASFINPQKPSDSSTLSVQSGRHIQCHSFYENIYVSLKLRVRNRRKKWNFLLNFRTMRKLSELYSRIFQNY